MDGLLGEGKKYSPEDVFILLYSLKNEKNYEHLKNKLEERKIPTFVSKGEFKK